MERISKILTWQMVAVLGIGGAAFLLIVFYAPPDVRDLLLGANGFIATIVAYYLKSPREVPPPPPIGLVAFGAFALAASACGASDAMRVAYAEEVARCSLNERAIVARENTTEDEDREALELERARCNAALEAIESGQGGEQ